MAAISVCQGIHNFYHMWVDSVAMYLTVQTYRWRVILAAPEYTKRCEGVNKDENTPPGQYVTCRIRAFLKGEN